MGGMRETLQMAGEFIQSTLINANEIKLIASAIVSLLFFFFGHLYTDALIAILMLMLIDTILGVAAVYKEGDEVTSRKFGRVVVKGSVYFSAISAGYFADLTVPFTAIQGTMVAFIGVTEFISVLENMGRLGYQTPKKLLNQLKEYRNSK